MRAMIFLVTLILMAAFIMPSSSKDAAKPAEPPASVPAHVMSVLRSVRNAPVFKHMDVQVKLHKVRTALHWYMEEMGDLPSGEQGLGVLVQSGHLRADDILDPWGREFTYRIEQVSENAFTVEYDVFVDSVTLASRAAFWSQVPPLRPPRPGTRPYPAAARTSRPPSSQPLPS